MQFTSNQRRHKVTSHKRWVQKSFSGDLMKWETEGQEIEGIWRGQRDGKFGPLGTVEQPDGTHVTFPLHTALVMMMEAIADGTEVKIVYTGKQISPKSGREFKAFDLFVAADGDDKIDEDLPF
jgi:hypothetical protein